VTTDVVDRSDDALEWQMLPAVLGGRVDSAELLTHNQGNAATGGVWRVRGPQGSAIVKVARPPSRSQTGSPAWQTSDDPTHWNYWRREVLAYTSGFASSVYSGVGIEPPDVLGHADRGDGSVELWLSEATGAAGTSWPVSRLARFARQLGVAQARWVDRVPDTLWLSRRWLAQYLDNGPARNVWVSRDEDWDHPIARVWPAGVRERLRRLWETRGRFAAAAETSPRTLCHLDVWPTNLVDHGDTSILLDWAFVGEGGLGEDVANLILDSVTDGLMPVALLPEIDAEVTDAYLEGLAAGGWAGSADEVRRAIAISGAAKYSWFAAGRIGRAIRGSHVKSGYDQDNGPEEAMSRLTGVVELLAEWSRALDG
jgi:hypothetical protein